MVEKAVKCRKYIPFYVTYVSKTRHLPLHYWRKVKDGKHNDIKNSML